MDKCAEFLILFLEKLQQKKNTFSKKTSDLSGNGR
jgi:hypothetical protein